MTTTTIPLRGAAYDNFVDSLHNDKTKVEYTRLLTYFAEWKGVKSLDELLNGGDTAKLKEGIKNYIIYLKKVKGLARGTRAGTAAALKHFYNMNSIELNWDYINKFIGKDETKTVDREYTYDEVSKILSIVDMKYKAIILLMCSSAIRVGAIPSIQYRDISKVAKHDIYKITVYRGTTDEYYTFCTPECFRAISAYLDFRQRSGEVLTPQSPLFRHDFDPTDKNQVKKATPLTHDAIKGKLRCLVIRIGIAEHHKLTDKNKKGRIRNEVKVSHGFRKFAITQMGRSRMDPEIREMLAGHKLGVRALYLKYSEEDRLNEYQRAIDNLTIDASNRLLAQVDEFKKQEREIQELKQQMTSMQQEHTGEIDSMQELAKNLAELLKLEDERTTAMVDLTNEFKANGNVNTADIKAGQVKRKEAAQKAMDRIRELKKDEKIDKLIKGVGAKIVKSKSFKK